MLRNKLFLLSLTILMAVIVGCSNDDASSKNSSNNGKVEQGGEIKIAYAAQPPSLDPLMTSAIATIDIMGQVYESLVTFDSDYNVQPMLAESFEQSEDGKEITFILRDDITFHNGKEVTADDVVASMERWAEKTVNSEVLEDRNITFTKEDDKTVKLTLDEPLSIILTALANNIGEIAAIMPKETIDAIDDSGVDEFIGTGPFKFVEWKQDQHVLLEKNDDYSPREEEADGLSGKKEALVDQVRYVFTPDSSTRVAGIQSGEFNMAHFIPYDNMDQFEGSDQFETFTWTGGSSHIYFNKKEGFFADEKARQAVAAALDMDKVLTSAYSNEDYYTLNHNMMMKSQEEQWYGDAGKDIYNNQDLDKVEELLDELNYNGEEIVLLTDRSYEDHYNAAIVVQEQLTNAGFNVELDVFDWPTTKDKSLDSSQYDMWLLGIGIEAQPSSYTFLSKDYAGWTDSDDLDEIIDDYLSGTTTEESQLVYEDLLEWYWNYLPTLKLGEFERIMIHEDSVNNFTHQGQLILWNVSLEK